MSKTLVVVDPQRDFISGSLAVPDADAIFPFINQIAGDYDYVVFTRDWHPSDHISFADKPEFVDKSWPSHCVKGTPGAELDPRLRNEWGNAPVFSKGTDRDVEEYSGFAGRSEDDTYLADWLSDHDVDTIDVVGLATDYCVKATAIDGAAYGFKTTVLLDGVRGVTEESTEEAIHSLLDNGVSISMTSPVAFEASR